MSAELAESVRIGVAQSVERILEAVAERDWSSVFFKEVGSFERFDLFLELAPFMEVSERKNALTEIWETCDSIWRHRHEARTYLREVGYIGSKPKPTEPVLLYRGVSKRGHRRGLSWTTELETARRFVKPFARIASTSGFVYSAMVPPEVILAGFDGREESEYVVDFELLPRVRMQEEIST